MISCIHFCCFSHLDGRDDEQCWSKNVAQYQSARLINVTTYRSWIWFLLFFCVCITLERIWHEAVSRWNMSSISSYVIHLSRDRSFNISYIVVLSNMFSIFHRLELHHIASPTVLYMHRTPQLASSYTSNTLPTHTMPYFIKSRK